MTQTLQVHVPCARNDRSGLSALSSEIDLALREICVDGEVCGQVWSEEGAMAVLTCKGLNADRLAEIVRRTVAHAWPAGAAMLVKGHQPGRA